MSQGWSHAPTERDPRPRRARERRHLEGCEPGIERDGGAARHPDGEQLGEELVAVPEVDEYSVARADAPGSLVGGQFRDAADGLLGRPASPGERLDERSDAHYPRLRRTGMR